MTEQKNKSWIIWIMLGLCILAIPIGLVAKSTDSEKSKSSDSDMSAFSYLGKDKIKVISLEGVIMDQSRESIFSLRRGARSTIKKLKKAGKNPKVKGVLLRINSPGGTVGASQEINQAVTELAKNKPVIATMGDIAASGGYYVACACDKIYANPGTLTGSIGVIMSLMNVKELADKVGIHPKVVKSGPFKDIASMYRPMTDEEKKLLQALIDDSYDQFVTAVSEGRKMEKEKVKKLADGRIYSGRQALKNGLVDKLGSYHDALDELQEVCKKKYNLKKDLKVDDDDSEGIISSLFETSKFAFNRGSHSEFSMLNEVIPVTLKTKFQNQPLWLMP